MKLYYFDASNPGMGFIPASTLTTDTSYSVVVNAGDILSINGENEPRIYFTQGQKYLFEQSDATNQEYRLTFPYYDTGSGTWIDTNTGITPHGVPGRNGAYTYFEPDTLADLTRVCLVKDGVRKTTLIAPVVTIEDISFGVLGKAYSGIPFTVTFTSGIDDGSFSITDANGVAIALTSPTATDLSYGTSSIEVTIGPDVLSGVMTIGGTNGITQTFDYVSIAQTFVVTYNGVFLIDGDSNVFLGLENGKSYMFDLSYSQNLTFALATEIDGANNSRYTDNIVNVSDYMIVQDVSASSTLYYYAVESPNRGKLEPQWVQRGGDIFDANTDYHFGRTVSISSDGSRIAICSPLHDTPSKNYGRISTYEMINWSWTQVGSYIYGDSAATLYDAGLDLSKDGNTLAVGFTNSGKVRVYDFSDNDWVKRGSDIFLQPAAAQFGWSVSLSSDANSIAIGARYDDAGFTDSGSVSIYDFSGNGWEQRGDKIAGTQTNSQSGYSVSLSADGNTVAIGALTDAARLFTWSSNSWSEIVDAAISGSTTSVSLTADGNTFAVTSTSGTTIKSFDGNSWTSTSLNTANGKVSISSDGTIIATSTPTYYYASQGNYLNGMVQVYQYQNNSWSLFKDFYGAKGDRIGWDMKISSDGSTVIYGVPYGESAGNSSADSGYVQVFKYV